MQRDPHMSAVIASMCGGLLYGFARIYAVAFSPTPAQKRDIVNVFALAVCSTGSACVGGYYVAPAFLAVFNIREKDLAGLLTVIIGIGFWQAIPGLIKLSSLLYERFYGLIDRMTGGQGAKKDGITQ